MDKNDKQALLIGYYRFTFLGCEMNFGSPSTEEGGRRGVGFGGDFFVLFVAVILDLDFESAFPLLLLLPILLFSVVLLFVVDERLVLVVIVGAIAIGVTGVDGIGVARADDVVVMGVTGVITGVVIIGGGGGGV